MRVGILGPLHVVADGRTVEVGGARLRALLARLALDAGRAVTAASLADALWPGVGPSDPTNALQSLVSRLRRALPGAPVVQSVATGYRLDLAPDAVDALLFERLARDGRRALRTGDVDVALRHLREGLALWRGEPLAGVGDAPYAAATVLRLTELRLTATEDWMQAELDVASEPSRLVAELEELTAVHPLRERLRGLLVRALDADGRPAEALGAYEAYRKLVADELGVDPGPELQKLHLAVLRGDASGQRSGAARRRGNLRAPLTSFVGRDQERARIAKQLEEGRLVTLVGPGGGGKTRLATTFAAGVADDVPGGAWLVELAPVTAADDLARTLAGALGLREDHLFDGSAGPHDPTNRLVEALSVTDTLLLLDNCEHVIDAVARLVEDLLGRCPRLRVLATSREPLGIVGEALCPVPPLPVPPPHTPAARAISYPAVRLFVDRAAAVRPELEVSDDNAEVIARICRRLDGLPLAIELAAARLRSLTIQQVTAGLDDRFRLLTGGNRTAVGRHQTLRAVVGWSWELLGDDERRLAERLAVFSGPVTTDSATHMGALTPPVPPAVLDTLSALVDKSLLQVVDGDQPRYRMLETVREYGMERLARAEDIGRVRAAHAAYFLGLAETAEPHLVGAGQLPWIHSLAVEHDNLLAALHFACDTADAATAVRLGATLGVFWTIRGNHAAAAGRLRLALSTPGAAADDATVVATALYLFNAVLSGGDVRADAAGDGLPTQVRRLGAVEQHPAFALIDAAFALVADDPDAGVTGIDRWLPHPQPWKGGMLWLMRSLLNGNRGDMEVMARDLHAAIAAFRDAGERWGLATALTYLASVRMVFGDFASAVVELEEAVRLLRALDPDDPAILQRVWIADARRHQGDVERARADLLDVVASGAEMSSASALAFARTTLGDLARYDGDFDEAALHYGVAAEDLSRAPFDTTLYRAMLLTSMGHLAVARDEVGAARRHLAEAVALAVRAPDMPLVAVVAVGVARLALCGGVAHLAAEVLGAAHALRGAPDAFKPDVAALVSDLLAVLDEQTYDAAYTQGRGLDRDGALDVIAAALRQR